MKYFIGIKIGLILKFDIKQKNRIILTPNYNLLRLRAIIIDSGIKQKAKAKAKANMGFVFVWKAFSPPFSHLHV